MTWRSSTARSHIVTIHLKIYGQSHGRISTNRLLHLSTVSSWIEAGRSRYLKQANNQLMLITTSALYHCIGDDGRMMKLAEIAKATGFGSESYLSLRFKKTEGISPSEYREKWM